MVQVVAWKQLRCLEDYHLLNGEENCFVRKKCMLEKILVGLWTDIILKCEPTSFHCGVHFSSLMNWYAQHIALCVGKMLAVEALAGLHVLLCFGHVQSSHYSTSTWAAQG